jgi:divalent metal cation (Fe/Co/Zn/Cd) transporter
MPPLARAKGSVGHRIGGPVGELVLADATETRLCALLSLARLAFLIAYSVAGWWWANPSTGFAIAYLALREGREAWEGE